MTLWIFTQQKASLPSWVPLVGEEFVHVTGEFTTAQAVTPGQGQAVDVAGIQIGKVTSVDLEDGHAVVGMDIEPKYLELIHPDASLLLRPKTNLNDMVVEVDPGTAKGHIEDGYNFPLSRTEPNVNLDAFLATLDADTRQYIQLLVAGGAQGIGGRGRQLSRRLPPPAALLPLRRRPQPRGGQTPRRPRPGDPRLRPADHRTGPPRLRDRTLRHLLQGGARQLRQPAAVDPGDADRVPQRPSAPRESAFASVNTLLHHRPPGAARPDPAGAGAGAGAAGQRAALRTDDGADPRPDPPLHPPDPPGPHPRQAGLGRLQQVGAQLRQLARRLQQLPQRARLQAEGLEAELPLLPALAQPRHQRHLQPRRSGGADRPRPDHDLLQRHRTRLRRRGGQALPPDAAARRERPAQGELPPIPPAKETRHATGCGPGTE